MATFLILFHCFVCCNQQARALSGAPADVDGGTRSGEARETILHRASTSGQERERERDHKKKGKKHKSKKHKHEKRDKHKHSHKEKKHKKSSH
jgi:hypothetical protein